MKKVFAVMFVLLFVKTISAQDEFKECFKNILVRMDSLYKLGKQLNMDDWKNCVLDKPMPNFTAITLSGDTIVIGRLKGKIVVINFWFIDCHPCIAELPGLNKLVEAYKEKDIVFLAMTRETVKRLKEDFLPRYKLDFNIIADAEVLNNKVVASGYPTTYVVDKQGIIRTAWNGGRTDEKAGSEFYEKAKPAIDKLLNAE